MFHSTSNPSSSNKVLNKLTMPTYDYKCQCAKETKENYLILNSKEVVNCSCGKEMIKQVSAPRLGNMDKLGRSK